MRWVVVFSFAFFCFLSFFHVGPWRAQEEVTHADHFTFNHPLDMTLACSGLAGWPKFLVEVGFLDEYGRSEICTGIVAVALSACLFVFVSSSF